MRKLTLSLLALILVATACSGTTDTSPQSSGDPIVDLDNDEIRLLAGLVPFQGCDELLSHLQAEARDRVGPYGLDYYGYGYGFFGNDVVTDDGFEEEAAEESIAVSADADSGAATGGAAPQASRLEGDGGGGDDFTNTNTQEAGVDEPDLIKTDGNRILVVSDNVLTYVDVSSGDPETTDSIQIPDGWGHELFFQGDRALLFTNGAQWGYPIVAEPGISIEEDAEASFAEDTEPVDERIPGPEWYGPSATIFEVDLSDPSDLEIVGTLSIQGQYLSARRVGDTVRMALTSPPSQLEWVYPSTPAGEDRAERFNRELIDETTIEDWIPEYQLSDSSGATSGPLLACDRLHKPTDFSGFDVVSVLSFGLDGGLDRGDGAGVLASGQTIYASTDRFYVATTAWAAEEVTNNDGFVEWNENYSTDIHAFSITPDEPANYVASGMVAGSLLNQFSMDEHDGYLRIITTDGSPWSETNTSETSLTVFSEEGDVLVPVGSVGGLGEGESLYAARLLDDIGFAVTFRQIDPFYVLDLSDPTDPKVSGELKIPGFSTYLHPIGDDYVLGVGQNATEEGRTTGLKVSLFKVTDPTNPTEVATWTMDNANSPVEYDHRAFQFLASENLAIVPFTSYSGEEEGAALLRIDDGTITHIGTVSQVPEASDPTSDCKVIEGSSFSEETEFFYIAEGGGRLQFCDADDRGGYGNYYCDVIPLDDLRFWGPEAAMDDLIEELTGTDIDPEERIEMCWPDGGNWQYQIQRSLVIGDTLWTMSQNQLQANDLNSLDLEAVVLLG